MSYKMGLSGRQMRRRAVMRAVKQSRREVVASVRGREPAVAVHPKVGPLFRLLWGRVTKAEKGEMK